MAAESGDRARTLRNDPAWPIDRQGSTAHRTRGMLRGLQSAAEVVGEGVIKMVRGDRLKVCEVCGEEFLASRRNAKTYRQRKKEVQQNQ